MLADHEFRLDEINKNILNKIVDMKEEDIKEFIDNLSGMNKSKKVKRPSYMQVTDPEHSIFDYISYFIELFKRHRRGMRDYIEKAELKDGKLIIRFKGYEKYLGDFKISMRHEYTLAGGDMVRANIREDQRDVFNILKKELSSKERRYSIVIPKEEAKPVEISMKPVKPVKEEKIKEWRLLVENRNELINITNRMRDPDKRAVWIQLINALPFRMLTEKDIYFILKNRGLSKENIYNLIEEMREEWVEEGWIEIA